MVSTPTSCGPISNSHGAHCFPRRPKAAGSAGVAAGVWGLLGGPLDVAVIVGGCVVGGLGDAGHYAIERGN
jgi:hypothetical protein